MNGRISVLKQSVIGLSYLNEIFPSHKILLKKCKCSSKKLVQTRLHCHCYHAIGIIYHKGFDYNVTNKNNETYEYRKSQNENNSSLRYRYNSTQKNEHCVEIAIDHIELLNL